MGPVDNKTSTTFQVLETPAAVRFMLDGMPIDGVS